MKIWEECGVKTRFESNAESSRSPEASILLVRDPSLPHFPIQCSSITRLPLFTDKHAHFFCQALESGSSTNSDGSRLFAIVRIITKYSEL